MKTEPWDLFYVKMVVKGTRITVCARDKGQRHKAKDITLSIGWSREARKEEAVVVVVAIGF